MRIGRRVDKPLDAVSDDTQAGTVPTQTASVVGTTAAAPEIRAGVAGMTGVHQAAMAAVTGT
jgi:hypothetical protein